MGVTSYVMYNIYFQTDYSGSYLSLFGYIIENNKVNMLRARITFALFVIFYVSAWIALFFSHAITRQIAKQEDEIVFKTYFDPVTSLPNRKNFIEKLNQAILTSSIEKKSVGLLLLDLNHFTVINDTLGHAQGDIILKMVADRISEVIGKEGLPARLSSDEFGIIIPLINSSTDLMLTEEKISEALQSPFLIDNKPLNINGSFGATIYPQDGELPEILLKNLEVAIQDAKRTKNRFVYYSSLNDNFNDRNLKLMTEIGNIVTKDELFLCFQPKIITRTEKFSGVEALVRWNFPDLGIIPPDEFISIAEKTGHIREITKWVLKETLNTINLWDRLGVNTGISMNLSAIDLQDKKFPDYVKFMLQETKADPTLLTFEITESAIMADRDRSLMILDSLHALGIKLSIDDFGTGYSSLSYLQKMPVSEIKIDKSFIINLKKNDRKALSLVKSIIDLAHNLDMKVVAEGIEDISRMMLLRDLDCDIIQGFYVSKPQNKIDIEDWFGFSPYCSNLVLN